jgi:hypothetical protein
MGQATDDNMVQAHCMLDTLGSKHTPRLRNNYCFSTVKMVARKRYTLYVHCLHCYISGPTLEEGPNILCCSQILQHILLLPFMSGSSSPKSLHAIYQQTTPQQVKLTHKLPVLILFLTVKVKFIMKAQRRGRDKVILFL